MATLQFLTVDVFTQTAYEGNPLAIIKVPSSQRSSVTQEQKQLIAREFNLSETVFLHERRPDDAQNEWTIDIFTTTDEIPFAGHPTIGSASYVLNGLGAEAGAAKSGTLMTKAGPILISLVPSKSQTGWESVQADIPHDVHIHSGTLGDLRSPTSDVPKNVDLVNAEKRAPVVSIVKGMTFILVRLANLETLAQVEVVEHDLDSELLDQGSGWDQGLVGRYYYVVGEEAGDAEVTKIRSRMVKTIEDPATGSAACALSSYLASEEGRTRRFEITQGVEMGKRSVIGVEVVVDGDGKRVQSVRLSGSAVPIMEGSLRI